jgi:cysteine desulfurase family protein
MSKLVYLDNSATTFPKPDSVYKFMDHWQRTYAVNPGRSGYDLSMEAGNFLHETRQMLTRFFNGTDPDRLVFSYNASDSLNIAISGTLRDGDHVISTTVEHNSVLRPLHHAAAEKGVKVDHVPFDDRGFVDPDEIKKRFTDKTRLVVVNHGSNVLGTVQPVSEIGRLCHERGVLFAIDTAQTAGMIPIDVQAMNVDMLAFTGHKSLLGPMGVGGLYVAEGVDVRITRAGGTGVRSKEPFHLPEFPFRLEVGTVNMIGVAGLHAGQLWIEEQGLDKIHEREMEMYRILRSGLEAIDGVTLYCGTMGENQLPVLNFNVEGYEALDVGTLLDVDHNVACRTGLHCAPKVHEQIGTLPIGGSVRLSIGPLNVPEDVEHAVEAVAEIAKQGAARK